jgi:hypothetical protein
LDYAVFLFLSIRLFGLHFPFGIKLPAFSGIKNKQTANCTENHVVFHARQACRCFSIRVCFPFLAFYFLSPFCFSFSRYPSPSFCVQSTHVQSPVISGFLHTKKATIQTSSPFPQYAKRFYFSISVA